MVDSGGVIPFVPGEDGAELCEPALISPRRGCWRGFRCRQLRIPPSEVSQVAGLQGAASALVQGADTLSSPCPDVPLTPQNLQPCCVKQQQQTELSQQTKVLVTLAATGTPKSYRSSGVTSSGKPAGLPKIVSRSCIRAAQSIPSQEEPRDLAQDTGAGDAGIATGHPDRAPPQ